MANKTLSPRYFALGGVVLACITLSSAHADTASAPSCEEQALRQRPGHTAREAYCPEQRETAAAPQEAPIALPDRWRLVEMIGVNEKWYDPYNQNTLKGDRPLFGDWFLQLSGISDSVYEPRRLPTPVAAAVSHNGGDNDVLGGPTQTLLSETLLLEIALVEGDTTFRPPDWEFRFIPAFNVNHIEVEEDGAVNIDPRDGRTRTDEHFGVQGLFVDRHLRNVSAHYDFDAVRVGIQPFNADFRGFLFQDAAFGVRLFGNRDNNVHQYNLAWFRRLEKDSNSGLNDLGEPLRHDDVLLANYFWQDLWFSGFNSEFVLLYNRNREADHPFYDSNGFIQRPASLGQERPRDYDVVYAGYNGEGRVQRLGVSVAAYIASGHDSAGVFTGQRDQVRAGFAATEISYDDDWLRYRAHAVYASGDGNPYDDRAGGYDAVLENPLIAGADTSFWLRQAVPLIGGGRIALSTRNGVLANLRSSKEHGQSNFVNPGLRLFGVGLDADLTPQWRLSANLSDLYFDRTEVLEAARAQTGIDNHIGQDISFAAIYRPLMSQNIVCRLSVAALLPAAGYEALFGDQMGYSVLANLLLTY